MYSLAQTECVKWCNGGSRSPQSPGGPRSGFCYRAKWWGQGKRILFVARFVGRGGPTLCGAVRRGSDALRRCAEGVRCMDQSNVVLCEALLSRNAAVVMQSSPPSETQFLVPIPAPQVNPAPSRCVMSGPSNPQCRPPPHHPRWSGPPHLLLCPSVSPVPPSGASSRKKGQPPALEATVQSVPALESPSRSPDPEPETCPVTSSPPSHLEGSPTATFQSSAGVSCEKVLPLHMARGPSQGCIRMEGTLEAAPAAVRQAVGRGCRSGWRRLLSVTNAIEVGTWHQGDGGWA